GRRQHRRGCPAGLAGGQRRAQQRPAGGDGRSRCRAGRSCLRRLPRTPPRPALATDPATHGGAAPAHRPRCRRQGLSGCAARGRRRMSFAITIALVLALAAVAGSLRRSLRWRRLPPQGRPGAGHLAAILLLQCACAALLYAALLPPGRSMQQASLVLMTAGTDPAQARQAARDGALLVALPEAGSEAINAAAAQRMPDLATALRRHPQARRLHVLGSGLETRDRESTRGLPLAFDPPPLPSGLVALHAPARVASGGVLRVTGRLQDAATGGVELLDPAGTVQDRATADDEGRFRLQAPVRASGPAIYTLRLAGEVE